MELVTTGIKYTYLVFDRGPNMPDATAKRLQPYKDSVYRPGRQHHAWPGLFKLIGPPTAANAKDGAICPSCGREVAEREAIMYISQEWICAQCVSNYTE